MQGLIAAGVAVDDPAVAAGLNWLVVHQQPSGGWGETVVAGEAEADYLSARPTASQTAWALLALAAAGRSVTSAAHRAVHFLLETQEDDGHWDEPHFTLRDPASGRWFRNELHACDRSARSTVALGRCRRPATTRKPARVQLRLVGAETA